MAFFIPAIAGAFPPGNSMQGSRFHSKGRHRSVLGIWRNPEMVKKLGITAEQVKQLKNKVLGPLKPAGYNQTCNPAGRPVRLACFERLVFQKTASCTVSSKIRIENIITFFRI